MLFQLCAHNEIKPRILIIYVQFQWNYPIGPNVAPLAKLTFKGFFIMLTLSETFWNICCDMHEHVAPVSNRAVLGSALGILTAKVDDFNCAYSKLDIV